MCNPNTTGFTGKTKENMKTFEFDGTGEVRKGY